MERSYGTGVYISQNKQARETLNPIGTEFANRKFTTPVLRRSSSDLGEILSDSNKLVPLAKYGGLCDEESKVTPVTTRSSTEQFLRVLADEVNKLQHPYGFEHRPKRSYRRGDYTRQNQPDLRIQDPSERGFPKRSIPNPVLRRRRSSSDLGETSSDSNKFVPWGKYGVTPRKFAEKKRDFLDSTKNVQGDEHIPRNIRDSSSKLPYLSQVLPFSEPNKLQLLTAQSSGEDHIISISSSIKDWTKLPHLRIPSEPSDVLFHALIQKLIIDGQLFGISFPCNRIPNWFSHGSSNSSLSIDLSPKDNHNSLEGIALSVVFVIKEDKNFDADSELRKIYCDFHVHEYRLKNPIIFENFKNFGAGSFGICCYIPQEWFAGHLTNESKIIKASVSLRLNVELKMLGIHPIYGQDVEEFSKSLAQVANEHREIVLDFSRHCEKLFNSAEEDIISWYHPREKLTTSREPPPLEVKQDGSDSTTQTIRDIKSSLSRLFEGRYAQQNRFYLTVPLKFFSLWFFHHSMGDTTICYLPQNLNNDESWVGLELYVLFNRSPTVLRSDLDSYQTPCFLHIDIYTHGDSTLPILTYPLLIDDAFFGSHFVFIHVPRECFLEQLNQCRGISALFRPSTSDLEVEMCGTSLLYEKDSESLIQVIIDSAQGRKDAFDLLRHQILRAETRQCDEVEQELPHFGHFSSFERERIDWLQKLLTSTEQVAKKVPALLQDYRFFVAHNLASKYFDSVLLHSKYWLSDNQDHIHETSSYNHLHIMAETLIVLGSDLLYWKEDIKLLLKKRLKNFVVTLSFKGHIVFGLKHFDTLSIYNLCFPRKEILEWFKHQNSESKLGLKLPPNLYNNNNWRGLAICTAFSFRGDNQHQILSSDMPFKIMCHLKASKFCLNPVPVYSITKEKLKWLDHGLVWLAYIPRSLLRELNEESYVEARIYSDFPGLMVKTCGIHLLYQQEVEEFKHTIIDCWTSFFDNLDSIYQSVVDKDDEKLPDSDN